MLDSILFHQHLFGFGVSLLGNVSYKSIPMAREVRFRTSFGTTGGLGRWVQLVSSSLLLWLTVGNRIDFTSVSFISGCCCSFYGAQLA
jgi:hypothetical protein